jgi:hypothetical protein
MRVARMVGGRGDPMDGSIIKKKRRRRRRRRRKEVDLLPQLWAYERTDVLAS